MKEFFVIIAIIALMSCSQSGKNPKQKTENLQGIHKVIAKEVIHTSNYTYLRVMEDGSEAWVAIPLMEEAKAGNTYYFKGGFEMKNFESKELKRKFSSVIFLDEVSTEPIPVNTNQADMKNTHGIPPGKPKAEKQEIKIAPAKGGITIKQLFANKKNYAGKTVLIKGQVTKYTPEVMGKNWLHIQDGTEYEGSFDLTVSTNNESKVGDVITLEGKITLDKNLGYGYFYDVLLEDAKLINN
jgi:hypothetical protein